MNIPGYIKLKSAVEKDGVMYGEPAEEYAPVVHGRWITNSDGYYPQCSNCMREPESGKMTKFCSNCGAKMDESEENQ